MRRVAVMLVFVGCAKSAPPPEPPSNKASTEPAARAAPPAPAFFLAGETLPPGPAGTCTVGGFVIDKDSRETLPGVTIVIGSGDSNEPVITEVNGAFLVTRADVPDTVHAYYLDLHVEASFSRAWCGQLLRVELDQRATSHEPIEVR